MKRGMTGKQKLIIDFPDHYALFVQLKSEKWCQVTWNDFRSYDGPRRYTDGKSTVDHVGRLFVQGTNIEHPQSNTFQIITPSPGQLSTGKRKDTSKNLSTAFFASGTFNP